MYSYYVGTSVVFQRSRLDFSLGELSGALGDSITVLPLVIAIGALSEFPVGWILLGFGLFQVVWGLYYGTPVSVEPMKALAALVIVGRLSTLEFVVAGLLAGTVLLVVGRFRILGQLQAYIGEPVVRGVQFGVALLLLEMGLQLGITRIPMAVLAVGIVLFLSVLGKRRVAPLVVLGVGGVMAVYFGGLPGVSIPPFSSQLFSNGSLEVGSLLSATAGQLAMTVGNAAVATSLLLSDYYDAEISPDELSSSMGVMNLVAVPLGMIPMCHGSGGVAGKYTFGARTAGSNVILGVLYAGVALFAAGLVMAFPLALLGVVLVLIALELGQTSLDSEDIGITLVVGLVSLLTSVGIGFVAGLVLYLLVQRSSASGTGGLASRLV